MKEETKARNPVDADPRDAKRITMADLNRCNTVFVTKNANCVY